VLVVLPRFGLGAVRTRRFGLHVVRNVLHFGGSTPGVRDCDAALATVFAIEFTMPVWTALLAMPILGERLNRGRTVMLVLGLAGILIILKPASGGASRGARDARRIVRVCLDDDRHEALVGERFCARSGVLHVSGPATACLRPALPGWVAPTLVDLPWIFAIGAAGLSAHFCLTRAFRIADATLVVPIDFLRLPLIAVVGMLFYGEPLELSIMLGQQ